MNISLCLLLTIPFSLFPFSFAHAQQPAAPRQAPKLAFAERMKQYVQAVGGTIDQTKSAANMIVSNTADARGGKVTIVIVNDQRKNLVGFYIYNFGSLKGAANREAVYKYLLATNDEITLGGFFVDSEDDIGYKYLVNASQPMTQDEFNQVYLTMAAVARERRAKIRELLGPEKN
ncbi:MAG TPA: YbjN domain-containing protein [Blastocatellia bacterium]|nr:YbjN domain-containing protein [Blastocatellia bacterium]